MDTTKTDFRPSINIVRDKEVELNYIPTTNSKLIFKQLLDSIGTSRQSFTIIGAYGTGKSAFLWAFEKSLNQDRNLFELDLKPDKVLSSYHFIRLVGEHHSISQALASALGIEWNLLSRPADLIEALQTTYDDQVKLGKGLILEIDEFGKFLEYAATKDPDVELYLLQLIAEFFNDPLKNALFINTLHQNFGAYALGLSSRQREEWDKVKGRFKELPFNEPVEQLLFLASERLAQIPKKGKPSKTSINKLFKTVLDANAFPMRDYFDKNIAAHLFPLDILSASVLTLGLQKFGQNQRSLFSFLESSDHLGLQDFNPNKRNPFFHLASVFDYLNYNFDSLLSSKYNPEQAKWASTKSALERVGSQFEFDAIEDVERIIKTIGLLNIFVSTRANLGNKFLVDYAKSALGISKAQSILKQLERKKIIRFSRINQRYVPFEGTDIDIEIAIDEAGNLIEKISEIVPYLNQHIQFPYLLAKESFYTKGTPRIFSYVISDSPKPDLEVTDQVDGFINLVFSEQLTSNDLKAVSLDCEKPVLFGLYSNTAQISKLLLEILKIRKVKGDHEEDRIAQRELNNILENQIRLLQHYVYGKQFGKNASVTWFYKGQELVIGDSKELNRRLSQIANLEYNQVPVFHNEMVNKTKLSVPINTARKRFISHLLKFEDDPNFGFPEDKSPPEKSIYLSYFLAAGIHRKGKNGFEFGAPQNESFKPLWEVSQKFIQSAQSGKRSLGDLVEILKKKPFKLKQGFIDFWLPSFLHICRNQYALFNDGKYIPFLTEEILQLVHKKAHNYEIKAFETEGIKVNLFNRYRSFLQLGGKQNPTNENMIETIRPFLVFYRSLNDYAKKTKTGLGEQTIALRQAIASAKDPIKLFFEKFPRALGTSITELQKDDDSMSNFIESLESCIRELRTSYMALLDRFEEFLCVDLLNGAKSFPDCKTKLQERIFGLNNHYVRPELKVLVQRIKSPLDDRDSWLNSIAQAVLSKPMDRFTDDDEKNLRYRLSKLLSELDGLRQISELNGEEGEEMFHLSLVQPGVEPKPKTVRLSIKQAKKVELLKQKLDLDLAKEEQNVILALLMKYINPA